MRPLRTAWRESAGAVRLLNVDLSTVTTAADVVVGCGAPLEEVVHLDFQSSAAAWKHADVLAYNALLFRAYHVTVHSIIILLRPQAALEAFAEAARLAHHLGGAEQEFMARHNEGYAAFLLGDTGEVLASSTLEEMAEPAGIDASSLGWSSLNKGSPSLNSPMASEVGSKHSDSSSLSGLRRARRNG